MTNFFGLKLSFIALFWSGIAASQSRSVYWEYEQKQAAQNVTNEFNSQKLGFDYWSNQYAGRGNLELLEGKAEQKSNQKLFFEAAAEAQVYGFRLVPALGLGNDSRYRPDSSMQLEVRYNQHAWFWPYLAEIYESYKVSSSTSNYLYTRAGSYFLLPIPGLVLNFYLQHIQVNNKPVDFGKAGNGQLLGINYYGEKINYGAYYQRNCIAYSFGCSGGNKDYYSELGANTEYRLNRTWSVGGSVSLVETKSQNSDQAIPNLSTDSSYYKLLFRYSFM